MTAELTLWKDRDPAAMCLPGIYHGALDGPPDNPVHAVGQLASEGVQFVRVPEPVDLTDPDGASAVAVLLLVRELTGHGIAVDWTLRMADPAQWQALSHLYPPTTVLRGSTGEENDAGVVTAWRGSFHIAKCGYRRGPGFLEIRDHRWGSFRRLVVNAPRSTAFQRLLDGVPAVATASTERVLERHLRENLVHRAGHYVWWTPYRLRRWPLSTTIP
ncbi:DUF5825 family protein [Streptomyces sp. NBC_01239]|uniref:DUF5825 family protein n=1 Tax=Streptomyces sp. NBC_01239 TaxID=2903792 RepID=UPI0022584E0F|nr:DUF5825 family protein [Streptomyces sp. NBC_01239]MCX4816502.1 DUF5825 family protein [Streptomyces sp. NBC_01239]